jgi:hypothetical protein
LLPGTKRPHQLRIVRTAPHPPPLRQQLQ